MVRHVPFLQTSKMLSLLCVQPLYWGENFNHRNIMCVIKLKLLDIENLMHS